MTTLHPGVDCWAVICRQDDWVEQSIVKLNSTSANAKEDCVCTWNGPELAHQGASIRMHTWRKEAFGGTSQDVRVIEQYKRNRAPQLNNS